MSEFASNNLYVKNYPENTSEKELQAIFGQYGPIISIKIPMDPLTGTPKPFGYVCFQNVEDAKRALIEQNGKEGLYVAYHKSKDTRQ